MNYVMHFCRNKKCNNGWVDEDLTHVKTNPPAWKYCQECCQNLGIEFNKQRPSDYMTDSEKEMCKIKFEKSRLAREKNLNSKISNKG